MGRSGGLHRGANGRDRPAFSVEPDNDSTAFVAIGDLAIGGSAGWWPASPSSRYLYNHQMARYVMFGENLTTEGLLDDTISIGDRLQSQLGAAPGSGPDCWSGKIIALAGYAGNAHPAYPANSSL
jgi:hypothetical protein